MSDRKKANTIHATYNSNFDINEQRYDSRLTRAVQKQDTIHNYAISPQARYATHSIAGILRDQAHSQIVQMQIKNKKKQDDYKFKYQKMLHQK